jgi:hypothetical protein
MIAMVLYVLDFDVKLDKLIAAVIVSNNGVVVAEQLAPFLRDPPGRYLTFESTLLVTNSCYSTCCFPLCTT